MVAVDLEDMFDPVLVRYQISGATAQQDRPEARTPFVIRDSLKRAAVA